MFSVADGASVIPGDVITASCETDGSTVKISDGTTEYGDTYTVPADAAEGSTITLTATASVKGENTTTITSEATQITLTVAKAPTTITETLTYADFTKIDTGNSGYHNFTYISPVTGIAYKANMLYQSNIGFIQLTSKDSHSGIITSANDKGYVLRKVSIKWNSSTTNSHKFDLYGCGTAYDSPAQLYATTGNDHQGTELGSLTYSTGSATELTITGDYQFIGIRSHKDAIMLDEITLEWEKVEPVEPAIVPSKVVITPAPENDELTIKRGQSVTFTSENATKLKVEDLYGSTDEFLTIDGNTYVFQPAEGVTEAMVQVTPIDNKGKEYSELSSVVDITIIMPERVATEYTFDFTTADGYYKADGTLYENEATQFISLTETNTAGTSALNADHWAFAIDENAEGEYVFHFEMPNDGNEVYFIKTIQFTMSGNPSVELYEGTETLNTALLSDLIWTATENESSKYLCLYALDNFKITGINVKVEHDKLEMPYFFSVGSGDNIGYIFDHDRRSEGVKIFYRITSAAAASALLAPAAKEGEFTEYDGSWLYPKTGDTIEAYAQHPNGYYTSETYSKPFDELVTGVDTVGVAPAEVRYYDLQGMLVTNPQPGRLYIRVIDGKAQKIVK